jgi:hypothetical protein
MVSDIAMTACWTRKRYYFIRCNGRVLAVYFLSAAEAECAAQDLKRENRLVEVFSEQELMDTSSSSFGG